MCCKATDLNEGEKKFPNRRVVEVKSSHGLKWSPLHPKVSTESPGFIFGPCSLKIESHFLPQELLLKGGVLGRVHVSAWFVQYAGVALSVAFRWIWINKHM